MTWIGGRALDAGALSDVGGRVAATFGEGLLPVASPGIPSDAYDAGRGQWSSSKLLARLASARPASASKILGVTDLDLFNPILTFVFGEAQLGGPAAVVSVARLSDAASRGGVSSARLLRECVHELGHAFGLIHCEIPCVMARSPSIREVDAKRETFCPGCRSRLDTLRAEARGTR